MRLTKLYIHGFKSFARKTELLFDDGITAVIGPNGSGKSNIADAVRWALGEQNARALRGMRMEDVIFNGTQERRPQSFCEVALTFDNADGTLPLDFTEISVTRRVYRSGESEYFINRNACRLKDITELFRDTGVGKEGYSIIGQGRVDEILSNKSNDRRAAIEEAAGIMRYRARKEEALRKLDSTKKNLERLEDILSELCNQREPLHAQAEKAREYLLMRDELKGLELNVFLHQYERMKERMENTRIGLSALEEEIALQIEAERTLSSDLHSQEEALRALETSAAELQNTLIDEMSAMDAHEGEAKVLMERRENLKREQIRLTQALQHEQEKQESLRAALTHIEGDDKSGHETLEKLDRNIVEKELSLKNLQEEIAAQEEKLEREKSSIIEQLNRLSDAKSQLSRMEAMRGALISRRDALLREQADIEGEAASLLSEQKAANADYQAYSDAHNALLIEQKQKMQALDDMKIALRETEDRKRKLESEQNAMRSRAKVLDEMSRAHEGYYASVRNLLRDCDRDITLRRAVQGVVAELLRVPREYEVAIEMTLGSALQNIVTPTPEHAKLVIEHLRTQRYGRATLLPISDMRPRSLSPSERAALSVQGCIGVASELVDFDAQYKSVAEYLLGRTVLVQTLDAGIALNRRTNASLRIATLDGDIISPGGSMTGGSVQKREFSLLGRERELHELQTGIGKLEGQIEEAQRRLIQIEESVREKKASLLETDNALHSREIENARHKEKLDLIARDLNANAQKLEKNKLEMSQITDNLSDIERERSSMEALQTGIEQGSAITQEDVQQSQALLLSMRERYEAMYAELTERKIERMALKKEEDALRQESRRLQLEIAQSLSAVSEANAAIASNASLSQSLTEQIGALRAEIEREQSRVDRRKEAQYALNEERVRHQDMLSQSRLKKDEMSGELRALDERKHKLELSLSRTELEFASITERITADYAMHYEEALAFFIAGFAITPAHVRIDELKTCIRELGNINVNAVEDYAALEERYTSLLSQCDDLNAAKQDLHTLIDELTATMERQFLAQFALIQENFSTVFKQLFGGGQAELRLGDPKEPLNCEIDIIAQPPGKKLQLLTLLSGGERALTAIALLFAMLKLKPTIFCILDEIETSLDEVNVARFANYLKRYSSDTQFILITHRKGSMEVSNTLYGVAMEEKGVSRLVSARFSEHQAM